MTRPKKDHGIIDGGPDKKPEKPGPPPCPRCGGTGEYVFGQMVVCRAKGRDGYTCDTRPKGHVEPIQEDDTLDDPVVQWPPWGFIRGYP